MDPGLSNVTSASLSGMAGGNPFFASHWQPILKQCQMDRVDSWAYRVMFESLRCQKTHIHPAVNLINNIGFGESASHTVDNAPDYPVGDIVYPLSHPATTQRDPVADFTTERIHFKMGQTHMPPKVKFSKKKDLLIKKLALPFCRGNSRSKRLIALMKEYPRFISAEVELNGFLWAFPDPVSFAYAYEQIFLAKVYQLPDVTAPRIIDCGANVGIASIYWAEQFPEAEIIAVEADPVVFKYLAKNVSAKRVKCVQLINKAVWHQDGSIRFSPDNADGGGIADCLNDEVKCSRDEIEVETVCLSSLVAEQHVDLLKIDIEGAECELLVKQQHCLKYVQRVFVEYHSMVSEPQRLHELLAVLAESGFRVHVHSELVSKRPFSDLRGDVGMDNRLNIFAWKI